MGRTRPMVVACSREDHPEESECLFLVKALGCSPDVYEQGLFSEIFGNCLAAFFGIHTAPPALILFDDVFIRAHAPLLAKAQISLKPGIGAGAQYLTPIQPFFPERPLQSEKHIAQAASLFAYDMLVQNPDRRPDKPNCGWYNGNLLAFDFEMAFSFLHVLGSFSDPWNVDDKLAQAHVLRPTLRFKVRLFGPFRECLEGLSDGVMEDCVRSMPGAWQDNASRIIDRIRQVRIHATRFENALNLEVQR